MNLSLPEIMNAKLFCKAWNKAVGDAPILRRASEIIRQADERWEQLKNTL